MAVDAALQRGGRGRAVLARRARNEIERYCGVDIESHRATCTRRAIRRARARDDADVARARCNAFIERARERNRMENFYAPLATHRVVLPIRETLEQVAFTRNERRFVPAREMGNAAANVPYENVNALPVAPQEKTERALWHATTKWERAEKIWRVHTRRACKNGIASNGLEFARFSRDWWGLESALQLPIKASTARRTHYLTRLC